MQFERFEFGFTFDADLGESSTATGGNRMSGRIHQIWNLEKQTSSIYPIRIKVITERMFPCMEEHFFVLLFLGATYNKHTLPRKPFHCRLDLMEAHSVSFTSKIKSKSTSVVLAYPPKCASG